VAVAASPQAARATTASTANVNKIVDLMSERTSGMSTLRHGFHHQEAVCQLESLSA
jgi:hypothetical protein